MGGWDEQAYKTMADEIEYWKNRALQSEDLLQRYIEQDNPAIMGEPKMPWTGWCCQYPDKIPRLYGSKNIAELNYHPEQGDRMFLVMEVANNEH